MSWSPAPSPLRTRWAAQVDPNAPLPEYPRPQLRRARWQSLNGLWEYRVGQDSGRILVPFPVESSLSGVGRRLEPGEALHYRRPVRVPEAWRNGRVMLHFGAVDHRAVVRLDGGLLGEHSGGFLPFSFDVTDRLRAESVLEVEVSDPSSSSTVQRGKQSLNPRLAVYGTVSGIWQTAWLEPVPRSFLRRLRLRPDPSLDRVHLRPEVDGPEDGLRVELVARDEQGEVGRATTTPGEEVTLLVDRPRCWGPGHPQLYDLVGRLMRGDAVVDEVHSYFALRWFDLGGSPQGPRLRLNGEPCFQLGVLDQGWWPDGLYTAPTDEALCWDVEQTLRLGFTMSRKHVKVEPLRWYHHCDRLGLPVWQDMPNGGVIGARFVVAMLANLAGIPIRDDRGLGRFGRQEEATRQSFLAELDAMIDHLADVPCICGWVPFNEGWGQFDSAAVARRVKAQDPTRPVDAASGWFDQGAGDIHTVHTYVGPGMPKPDGRRAVGCSEYGGIGLSVDGHLWRAGKRFVYRMAKGRDDLTSQFPYGNVKL